MDYADPIHITADVTLEINKRVSFTNLAAWLSSNFSRFKIKSISLLLHVLLILNLIKFTMRSVNIYNTK
jgi:hypothetical protein